MKKTILALLLPCLIFSSLASIQAAEEISSIITSEPETMVSIDEDVESSELGVGEPKLLPGHPFYFVKDWTRNIRSFLTLDPVKKAELESQFANEKLLELQKLSESSTNEEIIEKTAQEYQERIRKTEQAAEKIKNKSDTDQEVKNFSEKYSQHQILHQKILQKIGDQVPEKAFEKIKESREAHLENFKNVMTSIEEGGDIADRLDSALEKIQGSYFKEIKELEILEKIKEKFPENIREELEEKTEERINRLKDKLENASSEDQEKLQAYIQKVDGDAEVYLNIIDNLKGRIQSGGLEEVINKVREINLEKIQEQNKNQINAEQIQSFIANNEDLIEEVKTYILKNDLDKTSIPEIYSLVQNAELDLGDAKEYIEEGKYAEAFTEITSSNSLSRNTQDLIKKIAGFDIEQESDTNEIICSDREIPVCGQDGTTYKNICEAKKAGVGISYREKCQNLECGEKGEKVNRNPFLGPTNQKCCEGLEEFRVSRSYSICDSPQKEFECEQDSDCPLSKSSSSQSKCVDGKCLIPEDQEGVICIQVITPAEGPNGECKEFSTPCDVPQGWTQVDSCPENEIQLQDSLLQERIKIQNQLREEEILEAAQEIKESLSNQKGR